MSDGYRYIDFNEEEKKYIVDKLFKKLSYSDFVIKNNYEVRLHAHAHNTLGVFKGEVMKFLFKQVKYVGNKTEGFFGQKKTFRYEFTIYFIR